MKGVGCTCSMLVDAACMRNSNRSSPSCRVDSFSASHEIPRILWNL